MVGHLAFQTQPTKPPIGQVEVHFLAQPPLRADAIAVANDEHPDHQLGVDRRTPNVAVMGLQLLVQIGKRDRHEHVDPTQQMVLGNAIFEPELVEQTALIPLLPPHHDPGLRCR